LRQNDEIITDPLRHWVNGQAMVLYVPRKDLFTKSDNVENGLLGFMTDENNKNWYLLTEDEMTIVGQIENYLYEREYPVLIDGEPSYHFLDLTSFYPDQIQGVLRLTIELKYFSEEKIISALKDATLPKDFVFQTVDTATKNP